MWRDTKQKNRSNIAVNNNRLRLVVAVIFLLIGSVIYKLYSVQIGQFDMYTAMASSQHHIYSKLVPERGKIFFGERTQNGSEKLYPLATNKDFAEVFVVHLEITNQTVL